MRPIKFRGKIVDHDSWIYGSLVKDVTGRCRITESEDFSTGDVTYAEVIPETVGQFTGKKGRENNDLYEGDWCQAQFRDAEGIHVVQGQVIFDEYMWCLDCTGTSVCPDVYSINRLHNFYTIGNVFDNPDLLSK